MPLVFNYTNNEMNDNTTLANMVEVNGAWRIELIDSIWGIKGSDIFLYAPFKEALSSLISIFRDRVLDTVSLTVTPLKEDPEQMAKAIGDILRSTDWSIHPTHVLTIICSESQFKSINLYFQGTWHL